ncbi:MAG TPA: SAM-dependent methyltransferase [Pseudonocardiaceae bacterium]|nr:SAM-dependent methyltransferase [Pseudonocardiaceae bacterium]
MDTGWVPPEVDTSRANIARVYDYLLDGGHNFAIDRELAEKGLELLPNLRDAAWLNRSFLRRAVLFCVDNGIRQFLDIGSGVPTVGNVHEVAQKVAPDSKVVYVDNEPVAVAHSELLLEGNRNATVLHADARRPDDILTSPVTRRMLDFDQPVAVLMVALLHSVPDGDDPAGIVARFRDAVAPGSWLVLSHGTGDKGSERLRQYRELYRNSPTPVVHRTHAEVVSLFDGWNLVEPGVVFTPEWRPEPGSTPIPDPERGFCYAGVARKP